MTTTAQSIIQRAQDVLQDSAGTRWGAPELVRHLNDGQREITRLRPDQVAWTYPITLGAGHIHMLSSSYQALIDIPNNSTGKKLRITKVDMLQLDAVEPGWRGRAQTNEVKHFMHDLRDPRVFQVYPPVLNGTQVDAVVAEYPTDVGVPSGAAFTTVSGNISLPDHWADALLNFVLFKAYSKDAEYGGNTQIAAGYLGLFNAAIGSQLQSTSTVAPQT
jgi:hypothetical protein